MSPARRPGVVEILDVTFGEIVFNEGEQPCAGDFRGMAASVSSMVVTVWPQPPNPNGRITLPDVPQRVVSARS